MPTHFSGCLAAGGLTCVNLPSNDILPCLHYSRTWGIADAIYLHFAEDFHKILKKYQKINLEANVHFHTFLVVLLNWVHKIILSNDLLNSEDLKNLHTTCNFNYTYRQAEGF